MERRSPAANAKLVAAMEAMDVRVSIDDLLELRVVYNFKHPRSILTRFYSCDPIPKDVLAKLEGE
jgi:hypothetical protein